MQPDRHRQPYPPARLKQDKNIITYCIIWYFTPNIVPFHGARRFRPLASQPLNPRGSDQMPTFGRRTNQGRCTAKIALKNAMDPIRWERYEQDQISAEFVASGYN